MSIGTNDVTEEQWRVITHGHGHAAVTAVAGSGKTAAMLGRVTHLLERGVVPTELLVVMFNRAAADEFRGRLRKLGVRGAEAVTVRTFHALGKNMLEGLAKAGRIKPWRLVDDPMADAGRLLAKARREAGIQTRRAPEELAEFLSYVDWVKCDLVPAAEILESSTQSQWNPHFLAAYQLWEEHRRAKRVRYFADLVKDPVLLMEHYPDIARMFADRLTHIIVDEYQDINAVQQVLLRHLAGRRAQVMVVGDPDQCIYQFRGARPEFIQERFFADFPGAARYRLTRTFRYGHALSLFATRTINHNRHPEPVLCVSAPGTPATTITRLGSTPTDGLGPVARELLRWQQERSLGEAAVLVRTWSAAPEVEMQLKTARIPYRLPGRETSLSATEMRALLTVLRLGAGRFGEWTEAQRVAGAHCFLMTPWLTRNASLVSDEELQEFARRLAAEPDRGREVLRGLLVRPGLGAADHGRVEVRAELWDELAGGRCRGMQAHEVLNRYLEKTHLVAELRASSAAGEARAVAICAVLEHVRATPVSLGAAVERLTAMFSNNQVPDEQSVLITTAHQAKGLEWPLVVVASASEGMFPSLGGSEGQAVDIEAERRLFYVAVTRARERLVLAPSQAGLPWAPKDDEGVPVPSRFLHEGRADLAVRLGAAIHEAEEYRGQPGVLAARLRGLLGDDDPVAARYVQDLLAANGLAAAA